MPYCHSRRSPFQQFGAIDISSLKSTNRVKIAFMHAGQSIVEAMWDLLETF
jgi:hypothetical protein